MSSHFLRCLFIAALAVVASCDPLKWKVCEKTSPLFVPTYVDLDPGHVVPGSDVLFTIKGENAVKVVEAGTFAVDVFWKSFYLGRQRVYGEKKDLCQRASCPIRTGDVEFTYKKHMPLLTPVGSYDIKLVARELVDGKEGALLMCLNVELKINFYKAKNKNRKTITIS